MTNSEIDEVLGAPPSRWPGVVGTIGLILGAILFLDQIDDLLIPLVWTEDDWSRMLGPETAELVVRSLPPPAWLVTSSLVGMALAALLVVGSSRLRRRRRSGVTLCRTWSWLAIAWVAIDMASALWWLQAHADEIPGLASTGWQGYAAFGIVVALVVMLAYPVFLLVWLSRPEVAAEHAGWSE